MAQTTTALSGVNFKIEISTDGGTTWTDVSGSTNKIGAGEQERQTGDLYTGDGAGAIITGGKLSPVELDIDVAYTETAGEARAAFKAAHDAGGLCQLRLAPAGGTSGDLQYTSATGDGTAANGIITKFPLFPELDAGSADPRTVSVGFKAPSFVQSTIV